MITAKFDKYVKPFLTRDEVWIVKEILQRPARDLSKNKKVQQCIKKHGVYITLTSSPARLRNQPQHWQ